MKIAILGGGLTGLTAAYYLSTSDNKIFLYEKEKNLGGLAQGFCESDWDWFLEKTYHHLFSNDYDILNLAQESGFEKIYFSSPVTASLISSPKLSIYPFDTPIDFLKYPHLGWFQKIRTGAVIAALKASPYLKTYEKQTSEEFLKKTMGNDVWFGLWEELFRKKFGKYAGNILASFFWARIKKRTKKLAYIKGGFQSFIDHLESRCKEKGVVIKSSTQISEIKFDRKKKFCIEGESFDLVISTLPTPVLTKISKDILPQKYINRLDSLKYLHAVTLIIKSKKPIFKKYYWVNVLSKQIPITVLVQHTNFVNKKHYGNDHLLYIGNYVDSQSELLKMGKEELLNYYLTYLENVSGFKFHVSRAFLFKAPFAQPIFDKNFLKNKPEFITPVKNFYIANLDMTFPYDRGTNYAVKLGKDVAKLVVARS